MMRKTVWIAGLLLTAMIATLLSAALPGSSVKTPQPATPEVKIDNFSFGPTTLAWINRDDIPHTVVSTEKMFKSKALDTDEKFRYTFTKAGTYPCFCSVHPKMAGSVVVE